jgi:hypothetical protein
MPVAATTGGRRRALAHLSDPRAVLVWAADYAMTFLGWLGGKMYLSAYLKNAQGNRAETAAVAGVVPVIAARAWMITFRGNRNKLVGIVQRAYEQEER